MLVFYLSLLETQEEKDKFEQLYIQYRKLMFYIAKGILQDDFLAEDAVHNAFLRIINHLDKIEEISCHKTKSFMVIVVENVSKDLYNKRKKRPTISNEDIDSAVVDKNDVADNIIAQMTAEEVIKKIQLLPDIFREVLLLKFVHEMNDKEIAKVLEISPAAARKRVERARQRIAVLCNRG